MEDRYVCDPFCGWAESKGRGSKKCWVLLVEEETSNKIIKVNLTDVFSERFKRIAGVFRGYIGMLVTMLNIDRIVHVDLSYVQGKPH